MGQENPAWHCCGGGIITLTSLVRRRADSRCDDCLRVLPIGTLHYHRDKDDRTYCLECYERHRASWLNSHDLTSRKQSLLEALSDHKARTSTELQSQYGPGYKLIVRQLKLDGTPIWVTRAKGHVWYSLGARVNSQGVPLKIDLARLADRESGPSVRDSCFSTKTVGRPVCISCKTEFGAGDGSDVGMRFCPACIEIGRARIVGQARH